MKLSRKGSEIRAMWVKVSIVFFLGWLATSFLSLRTQEVSRMASSVSLPASQRTPVVSTRVFPVPLSQQSESLLLSPASKYGNEPGGVNISSRTFQRNEEVSKVGSLTPELKPSTTKLPSLSSLRRQHNFSRELDVSVSSRSIHGGSSTIERHTDEIELKPQTRLSSAVNSHNSKADAETPVDCRKSAEGVVIVVTRSVVAPPRRPARLSAIAKTWAPEVKARGGEVIVLVSKDPVSECGKSVMPAGATALPFSCVASPQPLDLSTDKAEVFEWIVQALLLRNNGYSEDVSRINVNSSLIQQIGGSRVPLKYLLWCNDHTFVVPGALVSYIASFSRISTGEGAHRRPLYAGKELESGGRRFNSGAAGILLSTRTLEILTKHWSRPLEYRECLPPQLQPKEAAPRRKMKGNDSFGKVKEPGLLLADCLLLAGIVPNRTRDDFTKGGVNSTEDRFHAYGPQRLVAGNTDDWYRKYHARPEAASDPRSLGRHLGKGLECCAASTTTFHYVEAAEALAIHRVLENRDQFRSMADADRRLAWPKPNELSYSSPPGPKDAMWNLLLDKMIKYPKCAGT